MRIRNPTCSIAGIAFGALSLAALAACAATSSGDDTRANRYDASPLLANVAQQVIVPEYQDLAASAGKLESAVDELAAEPSAERVATARSAWRAMRQPWERGEAFLYGPAASQGFDPRLDSWPLDARALERVVASDERIDATLVDDLDNNLRGFHTVEYLLWSTGDDSVHASAAAVAKALSGDSGRRHYLEAVAGDLHDTAAALRDAWQPGEGDFAGTMAGAGEAGNAAYSSQRAALQEIIQGMSGIAKEVAGAKLGTPLDKQAPGLIESRQSGHSRTDFANNLRSIKAMYLGTYPLSAASSGSGVSDYVQAMGRDDLDAAIRAQIDTTIERIETIQQPFREAVVGTAEQREAVEAAIAAARKLHQQLQGKVLPLLNETQFTG